MRWLWPLSLVACAAEVPLLDTGEALPPENGFSAARYTLAFDTTRLEATDAGWAVDTDLGYRVEITEGSLTTWAVALVACEDVVARSWLDVLLPTAHAGHGTAADPSTWSSPLTEDLVNPEPRAYGDLVFDEALYCRLHYLAWRADEETAGAAAADLGLSLRLVGTVTHPDGHAEPLDVSTTYGHGALLDLPGDLYQQGTLEAVVRRPLSSAFDGVDFATDEDVAWTVLGNLMDVELQLQRVE
ncbi:MAG: hypothetical protein EP330_04015 [Deltaproteobacteria bacterium]|nr:MAG: hypothetical protein EP330_04015 [Deltaproteobacteria bacterium]